MRALSLNLIAILIVTGTEQFTSALPGINTFDIAIATAFPAQARKVPVRGTPGSLLQRLASSAVHPQWPRVTLADVPGAADAVPVLLRATKQATSWAAAVSLDPASNPARSGPTRTSTQTSMSLPNSSSSPPRRTFQHSRFLRPVHRLFFRRSAKLRDRSRLFDRVRAIRWGER